MNQPFYQRIRRLYQAERDSRDYFGLFQALLSMSSRVGMDAALGYLEQCVIENRLTWLDENLRRIKRSGIPLSDGYKIFFEIYLGISAPADGEIVEATDHRLITRWWNECPIPRVCEELGLDTREICKKVYHRPVQAFLSRIDPRLRFDRNYDALRPRTPYCEEIITTIEPHGLSIPDHKDHQ